MLSLASTVHHDAATRIQSRCRMRAASSSLQQHRISAVRLQASYRRHHARCDLRKTIAATVTCQSVARCMRARRVHRTLVAEKAAREACRRAASITIQHASRVRAQRRASAAKALQAASRSRASRCRLAAVVIQACARRSALKNELRTRLHKRTREQAAQRVQFAWRWAVRCREQAHVILTGCTALDRLLGGGVHTGRVTLLRGPTSATKPLAMEISQALIQALITPWEATEKTINEMCEIMDALSTTADDHQLSMIISRHDFLSVSSARARASRSFKDLAQQLENASNALDAFSKIRSAESILDKIRDTYRHRSALHLYFKLHACPSAPASLFTFLLQASISVSSHRGPQRVRASLHPSCVHACGA